MATISNIVLSIVRDVANAEVTIDYDINWSSFDRASNLSYLDSFRLIEDDTNQDGDNLPTPETRSYTGHDLQQGKPVGAANAAEAAD